MNQRGLLSCGLLLSFLIVFFNVSCLASSSKPLLAPAPASTEVEISGFAYKQEAITVTVGTRVTWTNRDSVSHTVTSKAGVFDSGTLARNTTFSHSFAEPGVFDYYCAFHPSMKGKVIAE